MSSRQQTILMFPNQVDEQRRNRRSMNNVMLMHLRDRLRHHAFEFKATESELEVLIVFPSILNAQETETIQHIVRTCVKPGVDVVVVTGALLANREEYEAFDTLWRLGANRAVRKAIPDWARGVMSFEGKPIDE